MAQHKYFKLGNSASKKYLFSIVIKNTNKECKILLGCNRQNILRYDMHRGENLNTSFSATCLNSFTKDSIYSNPQSLFQTMEYPVSSQNEQDLTFNCLTADFLTDNQLAHR